MELDRVNKKFKGKRVVVFSKRDQSFHAGLLRYITTNMFKEHGVVAFFGRTPSFDIDIDSIAEFSTLLELMEIKSKYLNNKS